MNPITIIQNMTSEDVQRYARIVLQWLATWLVAHGAIAPNGKWTEQVIGVAVGALSLAWTVYGNRVKAKLVEVEKSGVIIVADPAMAKDTPDSPNILSRTEVKVVQK